MKLHVLILIVLVILIGVLAFLDYALAATLFWPFLFIFAVLGAAFTLSVWNTNRKTTYLLYLPAFLLLITIIRIVQFSPVKPFRLFYQNLKPGLSQQQVYERLEAYFPNEGRYERPVLTHLDDGSLHISLNPKDPKYDSEVVFITFQNGSVKYAEYSAD